MEQKILSEDFLGKLKALGIHQYAVMPVEKIEFSQEVRGLCEVNYCGLYGTTWACPPAVGSVESCKEKCAQYRQVYIFSTLHPLEDSFDVEGMEDGKIEHEKVCAEVEKMFREAFPDMLALTAEGCHNCKTCTYPDEPCRFPEKMRPSVESYGISVVNEAAAAGINYINGANTVTYFANIFFDKL